jgi:hypothetical protein
MERALADLVRMADNGDHDDGLHNVRRRRQSVRHEHVEVERLDHGREVCVRPYLLNMAWKWEGDACAQVPSGLVGVRAPAVIIRWPHIPRSDAASVKSPRVTRFLGVR